MSSKLLQYVLEITMWIDPAPVTSLETTPLPREGDGGVRLYVLLWKLQEEH